MPESPDAIDRSLIALLVSENSHLRQKLFSHSLLRTTLWFACAEGVERRCFMLSERPGNVDSENLVKIGSRKYLVEEINHGLGPYHLCRCEPCERVSRQ